jgi:hypothetical protein
MKQFITDKLVEMHKTCDTDQYGQVPQRNYSPRVFGDKANDVEQYCNENKGILEYSTYGASYGTYTSFTIKDSDIQLACRKALRTNENYLRNVNSW